MGVDNKDYLSFGWTLVALGIIFGTDRLIGYSLIGAGVIASILHLILQRNSGEL
jgi:hypothetical protein